MDEEERKKWVYDPDYNKKIHKYSGSGPKWWEPLAVIVFIVVGIALLVWV